MQKLLQREKMANGEEARKDLQLRLLTTDHLDDVIAGLSFLKKLPRVDANRIAIAGHFGGQLTLLAAERDSSVRAAVTFGAAAGSWEDWPELRERLLSAVRKTSAPLMLIHASNDYSTAPATRWRQSASGWASHRSSKFIRQSARHRRKATILCTRRWIVGNRRL
jgi:Dipeptidyl aminopeptidases/acylaminoacyl-peptidases